MFEKLKEFDYRDHPDTIEIEIAGMSFPWYAGRATFDLAEKHDLDFGELLEQNPAADEKDAARKGLEVTAKLAWCGFLVFDDAPDLDDVRRIMSFGDAARIQMQIEAEFKKLEEALGIEGKEAADPTEARLSPTITKATG